MQGLPDKTFPHIKMPFDPALLAILDEPWDTIVFGLDSVEAFGDILEGSAGYVYGRIGRCNPWTWVLECMMAKLLNAKYCLGYPSGMSALTSFFRYINHRYGGCSPHLASVDPVYGCTAQYMERCKASTHLDYTCVDAPDFETVQKALRKETAFFFVEPWRNPTLSSQSIPSLREALRKTFKELNKILLKSLADETFSFYKYIRCLELGCTALVIAGTKSPNGFGDEMVGFLISNDGELMQGLCELRGEEGPILNHNSAKRIARRITGLPPSHYDMERAISSLPPKLAEEIREKGLPSVDDRLALHDLNGGRFAAFLRGHRAVEHVIYPGGGGMVSFQLRGGVKEAVDFVNNLTQNSPLIAPDRKIPFKNVVGSNQIIPNSVSLGLAHKAPITTCSQTTHYEAFKKQIIHFPANLNRISIPAMYYDQVEEAIHIQLQEVLKQS